MRITALEVEGFGVWTGLRLDGLADGLNVFYGPNEAGKTTLMQFVRSVLYGFSPHRRCYFPPVHGGRHGGSLRVAGPQGEFRIARFDHATEATQDEELTVTGSDGLQHRGELLRAILGNVDEAIFNNVFAVELQDIQDLATLNGTEAASLLYNLSVGLDRVSLVEVMRELHGSRNRILDAGGGPCQVVQLLAERDRLRVEIEQSATLGSRYGRLAAERDQLDRETAQLEEESRQLGHELRILEIAQAVRPRLEKRRALDHQLAALEGVGEISRADVERLDQLLGAAEERRKQWDTLQREWQALRRKIDELKVNAAMLRQGPRIEALAEQEDWIRSLEERILELEAEIAEADNQWKMLCDRWKLPERELPKFSPRSLAALRPVAQEVRRCRQRLEAVRAEVAAGQEVHQSLAKQIQASLEARGERHLAEATERVGSLVAQLRRRIQIDQRLAQMRRHHDQLHELSRRLTEQQLLPGWALVVLGGLFVVGVVPLLLSLANLLYGDSVFGAVGSPLAVLGVVATSGAVVMKLAMQRSVERRAENCHRQLRMLHAQVQETMRERESLDRQLPPGSGSLETRLEAAERELASLEELVPLDAQREAARRESEAAATRVQQAEADLATARRRWAEAIAAAGFPKELSPKQVRHLTAHASEIQELQQQLARRRDDLLHRSQELESLTGRIRQLAEELGVPLLDNSPVEQLRALVARLREEEARWKDRRGLVQQARQLRRKRLRARLALARLRRRRRMLLDRAGVRDEGEFRRRAADYARAVQLRSEREAIQREIDAALAGYCSEEEILHQVDQIPEANLQTRREQLQKRIEGCAAQLKQRYETRGQLVEQLRAVAENRSPAAKRLELATVEKRLDDSIRRWQVLAVTHQVLEQVRKSYEQTRQPEALQDASSYLARLTQGHYRRVWTPLDEDVLVLDDADGKAVPVEMLSRGTREQLFLSLRLALADSYARRGASLPMVLDDVLVNFDTQRAKAAAGVLRDFSSAGHQLFVFTCHEHIARLFQSLRVEVHELPDHTQSRHAVTEARKSAMRQPKRRPPEPSPLDVVAAAETVAPPAVVPSSGAAAQQESGYDLIEELPPWEADDSEPPEIAAS